MNCRDILIEWLKEHGYDGLANPEVPCGCGFDEFLPCSVLDEDGAGCQPAYYDDARDGWFTDKPKEKL